MNFMKSAWLYVSRKRVRTLILFSIFSAVATALLIAQSLSSENGNAVEELSSSVRTTFTYKSKPTEQPFFDESQATELEEIAGVRHSSRMVNTQGTAVDVSLLQPQGVNAVTVPGTLSGVTQTIGTSNSEPGGPFATGEARLSKGRHISGDSEGTALVHESFAAHNNLGVGTSICMSQMIPSL